MNLVIDASIAAKWFFTELNSHEAQLLLSSRFVLVAPDFLLYEVANVVWKKLHRNEISSADPYMEAFSRLSDVINLLPITDCLLKAVSLSVQIGYPVYDCIYLICAQDHGMPLLTGDEQFRQKGLRKFSSVPVWNIGDSAIALRIAEESEAF